MINQINNVTNTLLIVLVYNDPLTNLRDFFEDFARGILLALAFYFVFLPLIFLISLIALIVAGVSYSKAKQRMDEDIDYYRSRLKKRMIIFLVVIIVVVVSVFYLFFS